MKLPNDVIIAEAKLTQYLLKWQAKDDKSKWLAQAGFVQQNWTQLRDSLRRLATHEANFLERTRFGLVYEIRGELFGPNGKVLRARTIWMTEHETGETKLITMHPDKERTL